MAKKSQSDAPAPAPTPARVIGGFAIFGPIDGSGAPDPVQTAMDAAVAEHNERQRAALAAALAAGRKR